MVAVVVVGLASPASLTLAGENAPTLDLDAWHRALGEASVDEPLEGEGGRRFVLGVNPNCSAVIGFPNLVAYQANLYLSLSDSSSFSAFVGYGLEGGSSADATIYTLGWGGVRRLQMAKPQWGFYGKFLRYRRVEDETHGVHHGLSRWAPNREPAPSGCASRSARPARSAITGWPSRRSPSRWSCRSGFLHWERMEYRIWGPVPLPVSAPVPVSV